MLQAGRGYRNQFRIIAGIWRRRRLAFPALPGIRPSPDRVRETVFNWLRERVVGARCLDLFAGSGALGLEALSGGAAECVFVDRERAAIEAVRGHLVRLHATTGEALHADAMAYLERARGPFDLVFLDPPFASDLLTRALAMLAAGTLLAPGAIIYIEHADGNAPALPPGWRQTHAARAGQVRFGLVELQADARPAPED